MVFLYMAPEKDTRAWSNGARRHCPIRAIFLMAYLKHLKHPTHLTHLTHLTHFKHLTLLLTATPGSPARRAHRRLHEPR